MTLNSVSGGFVGVGASPTYLLDVQTTSTTNDYILGRFVGVAGASDSRAWTKVERGSNYGGAFGGFLTQGVGGGFLIGTTNGSATPTERVRGDANGSVYIETGAIWEYAPTPATYSASATLTAADLKTNIITFTGSTAAQTLTLPTGTTIDTGNTSAVTNTGFDIHIINTATVSVNVALGASGMTGVPSGVFTYSLAANATLRLRLRRTAANTYVAYKLN